MDRICGQIVLLRAGPVLPVAVFAALLALSNSVLAQGVKCTPPGGSAVAADPVCGQKPNQSPALASEIAPLPNKAEAPLRPVPKRPQGEAGLSPECLVLRDKASTLLRTEAPVPELKRAMAGFQRRCGDQMERAARAAEPPRPSRKSTVPADAAACRKLRETLSEAPAHLSKMTDKEKSAYAKMQKEVPLVCR